jgi:hypothetical protein
MFEEPESEIREESGEGTGIGEDTPQGGGKGGIGGQGGEGAGAEAGTERIEHEGETEQTAHDAPEDDVGTPEDAASRTE